MKKLLLVATIFFLSMGLFARTRKWANFAGFGYRVPSSMIIKAKDYGYEKQFSYQNGLNLCYTGVHPSKFAVRATFDVNYTQSDKKNVKGENISGINLTFLLCPGYAPIYTDNIFIGFFATVGIDYDFFTYETSSSTTVTYREIYNAVHVGGNATMIFTPGKRVSFYGSLCIGCNLPGSFKTEAEVNSTVTRNSDDTESVFKFSPTLGICWKF
ncbi:MAG: hypothetical protein II921_09010 [Treponema sp.]|nr:hypothetical protein [Treponema sp.]